MNLAMPMYQRYPAIADQFVESRVDFCALLVFDL